MQKKRKSILIVCLTLICLSIPVHGYWSSPQNITLSQATGFNNETVNLIITGEKFAKSVVVKLTKTDEPDLMADNLKVISPTEISCSLNLRNKSGGLWDVMIININKSRFRQKEKSTTLREGFLINAPSLPDISIDQITPRKGFNYGSTLVTINGENFIGDTTVTLTGGDQIKIPGEYVYRKSASQITCFFQLNQKTPGKYDLSIRDTNGRTAVTKEAFTIVEFLTKALTPVPTPVISINDPNQELKPIFFDLNQSLIRKDQITRLEQNLVILKSNPKLYILIGGHTDERGSSAYNSELSLKRADAIKKYLLNEGIDPKRITIYAYGKDYPLKKGHYNSDWQVNRRVDILVTEVPPTKEQGIRARNDETNIP